MRLRPYGLGPCPRRRVGLCLIGSDIVMCGGVGSVDEWAFDYCFLFYCLVVTNLKPGMLTR